MRSTSIGSRLLLVVLAAAYGCGDDDPAERDAGDRDASTGGHKSEACAKAIAAVTTSLDRWKELKAAAEDSTYWYAEEDCAPNNPNGTVTTVRVDASGPEKAYAVMFPNSRCEERVNRLETLAPSTFEELYATCKDLVTRECDTTFVTDNRGIVRSCMWDKDKNCFDNCGHGFHLRGWGFGEPPVE